MKPEEFCVSFETSKRLKDAGFPQDKSYFVWYDAIGYDRDWKLVRREGTVIPIVSKNAAAPTTDELLVELPAVLESFWWLKIRKWHETYFAGYKADKGFDFYIGEIEDISLPETLSVLWLKVKG